MTSTLVIRKTTATARNPHLRNNARRSVWGQKPIVMDGPFAETKETIGGFFLLTCETREQAIAIAAECPAAKWATVEVRELGPCFE